MKAKLFFAAVAAVVLSVNVMAETKDAVNEVKKSAAPAKLVEALNNVNFVEGDVKVFFRVEAPNKVIVYRLVSSNSELKSEVKSKLSGLVIDGTGFEPGNYAISARYVDAINSRGLIAKR